MRAFLGICVFVVAIAAAVSAQAGVDRFRNISPVGAGTPHVYDVAVDPVDPLTLFVSTERGVLRSQDGGASWSDVKLAPPGPRESGDTNHWARLTMGPALSPDLFAIKPSAVRRSSDAGETWTAIEPGARIVDIAIDPANPSNAYAVLYDALARSLDGGSSWAATGVGQLPQGYYGWVGSSIAVDPVTPTTIYASGDGGIIKSVDGGTTWRTVFSTPFSDPYFRKVLVSPSDPSRIYGLGFYDVYRSDNGGMDWTLVHRSPGWPMYFTDLELDPGHPARLYLATSTGVWKSESRGDVGTWREFSEGLPPQRVTSLAVDASGVVYAGTTAGLFVNDSVRLVTRGASTWSVSLQTHAGDYVSANECGGSFLHANAPAAGRCETFLLYDLDAGELTDGDTVHLESADGWFVVAEDGGAPFGSYAPVNANRRVPAAWETFVVRREGGAGPIVSGDSISLQAIGGTYVSAEGGGRTGCFCDSRLSADRDEARVWETFVIILK